MDSATASESSELWGDLYSIYRWMYDSPSITAQRYYFQTLKGNNFTRPSFLVKAVTFRNKSRNAAVRWMDIDVMIQYHTDTQWDAVTVGGNVLDLFSGFPQVLIPKWDFTTQPPTRVSIGGVNQYMERVPALMGIRVDPDTVKLTTTETPDENFQAQIEFSVVSPRQPAPESAPILTAINWELLNYQLNLPTEVSMNTHAALSVSVV